MALKIKDEYGARANDADANYVTGSIKDRSAPGVEDGTPLTAVWGNDMLGFTDALLAAGGVAHSGAADTVQSSDRLKALQRYILTESSRLSMGKRFGKIYAAGVQFAENTACVFISTFDWRVYRVNSAFTASGSINTEIDSGKLTEINTSDIYDVAQQANSTASNNTTAISGISGSLNSLSSDVSRIDTTVYTTGRVPEHIFTGEATILRGNTLVPGFRKGLYIVRYSEFSGSPLSEYATITLLDKDPVPNNTRRTASSVVARVGSVNSFQVMSLTFQTYADGHLSIRDLTNSGGYSFIRDVYWVPF